MSLGVAQEWLLSKNNFNAFPQKEEVKNKKYRSKVVSVTGGKGGVGKTTLVLKFAQSLAENGFKVLIIDSDVNLSNTSVKLGQAVNDNFYELLTLKKQFDECLIKKGNLHLLPGCNGNLEIFNSGIEMDKVIIDIISEHRSEYDYIFIDSPAGLTKFSLNINAYCDNCIVVVNPERSSITDSYSLIKLLQMSYGLKEFHLVVNRVRREEQFHKIVKTMGETADRYLDIRLHVLGMVSELELAGDHLDNILFSGEKSSYDKVFNNIIKKFSDEHSEANVKQRHFMGSANRGVLEQEVLAN